MVRSLGGASPPPSGSLCSRRRTLSAVLPLSDLGSLLEIGQEVHRTNSGPKKPVGFFTVSGKHCPEEKNHRSRHPRFVGIPKGPPFGASFSILSVRAESMAVGDTSSQSPLCLGLPSGALGPLPCSSFPQQTHFVGLCRGPHSATQWENCPRRIKSYWPRQRPTGWPPGHSWPPHSPPRSGRTC